MKFLSLLFLLIVSCIRADLVSESLAELQSSGLSQDTINGIQQIWTDNKAAIDSAEAAGELNGSGAFQAVHTAMDAFIANVSTSEQEIWKSFLAGVTIKTTKSTTVSSTVATTPTTII